MSRDIFHQTRLLKAPSNLALNTSREGATTASLGNLCHCPTTSRVKIFFLVSNLNLPSSSLKPLSHVLSLQALVKSPSPAFLQTPFHVLEGLNKVFPESSLLQAETAPTLSAFPHRRGPPGLGSFLWPSSGPTPTAPCLSCAELTQLEVDNKMKRGCVLVG